MVPQGPHARGPGDYKFSLCHQSRRDEQFIEGLPSGRSGLCRPA
jgi:hypothetical protein